MTAPKMEYTIDCVASTIWSDWAYRVTIWRGEAAYHGEREYKNFRSAKRAAKATGATEREDKE